MARIKVNNLCNVVTEEHSNAYVSPSRPSPAPQITVPHLRLRLDIDEAYRLAQSLLQAVKRANAEVQKVGFESLPGTVREPNGGVYRFNTGTGYYERGPNDQEPLNPETVERMLDQGTMVKVEVTDITK